MIEKRTMIHAAFVLLLPLVVAIGWLFGSIGLLFTSFIKVIDLYAFYYTLWLTPLFLFSDVFFPVEERLAGVWLYLAEALPLLHPVRLARAAFRDELGWLAVWDAGYILGLSALLLLWARSGMHKRMTS